MSNTRTITCPHCQELVHLIQQSVEIKVNTAYHNPRCIHCNGFDHTTREHQKLLKEFKNIKNQLDNMENKNEL